MKAVAALLIALAGLVFVLGEGMSQALWEGGDSEKSKKSKGDGPKKEKPPDEDKQVREGLDAALKAARTERDRLLKELAKHYPLPPGREPVVGGGDREYLGW